MILAKGEGELLRRSHAWFARVSLIDGTRKTIEIPRSENLSEEEARYAAGDIADAARRGEYVAEHLATKEIKPELAVNRLRKLAPLRQWPATAGVYLARMPRTPFVKIGVAVNVDRRLRGLCCGFPEPVDLLAVVDGGRAEETALHRRFAALRQNGEWFWLGVPLVDFILEQRGAGPS